MKKNDERLCVVHSNGRTWGAVCYGYRGDRTVDFRIRTYLPGRLDHRIVPLKVVANLRTLARHLMGKNKQTPVIAKVAHIRELTGWTNREFAPPL